MQSIENERQTSMGDLNRRLVRGPRDRRVWTVLQSTNQSTASQMVCTCRPHMRRIRSRGCGFPRERNRTYVICGLTG